MSYVSKFWQTAYIDNRGREKREIERGGGRGEREGVRKLERGRDIRIEREIDDNTRILVQHKVT